MIVMCNGRETGSDRITMQHLCRVNVMHLNYLLHTVIPNIKTVHKQVEIEMPDGRKPPHMFTDLCWEFMRLTLTSVDSTKSSLFNIVMPIVSGVQSGIVVVTYWTDNKEAAVLIKKIEHSVALCFFGFWAKVQNYKLGMIQKLIESFDIDAAKLAGFSQLHLNTLMAIPKYSDADD
jgi:hypothetical protein